MEVSPATFWNMKSDHDFKKPTRMKKFIFFIAVFLLRNVQLFAQRPVYLTKAYKPVESDRY